MQPVTDAFLQEIVKSHVSYSYANVVSVTGEVIKLVAIDGAVSIDETASIRRSATITCIDPTGTLSTDSDTAQLTPYGTEVIMYRGVLYTSGKLAGSTEVVPLGVFRISQVTIKDTVGGLPNISIEAYDLSRTVSRQAFTDVYTVAAGYSVIQAVKDIINRALQGVHYDAFASTMVTAAPVVFDTNDDPWAAANTLAASAGCEVYFEADGRCIIAPPIDIDHLPAPVFSYIEGTGCTMTELDVVMTDSPGNNGVVLVGESTDGTTAPVRSVQWDTNPASPTYYLGPYGQVPLFITNSVVTLQADADAAAIAALNQVLGFHSQLSLTTMVNPALDCDDVVLVQRERVGVNAAYAVQSLSIPMTAAGTASIVLRSKRVS